MQANEDDQVEQRNSRTEHRRSRYRVRRHGILWHGLFGESERRDREDRECPRRRRQLPWWHRHLPRKTVLQLTASAVTRRLRPPGGRPLSIYRDATWHHSAAWRVSGASSTSSTFGGDIGRL